MEIKNSKNISTARIDAQGNVIIGDGNTIINLKEAAQYKLLQAQLNKLNMRFEAVTAKVDQYPNDEDFKIELITIDKERQTVYNEIENLKKEVVKLAEEFSKISINTERLRLAKSLFESGEFQQARNILNVETMTEELDLLLEEKNKLEQAQQQNELRLQDKASEFLILAHLTAIDFTLPDRFEKTKESYEKSLAAARTNANLFSYALFLHEHNQFSEALPLYTEALNIYKSLAETESNADLQGIAILYNNVGNLMYEKNELAEAERSYREGLRLARKLVSLKLKSLDADLVDLGLVLNNLSSLLVTTNKLDEAEITLSESLQIYKNLSTKNPQLYSPYVNAALFNIGNLFFTKNKLYDAEIFYRNALHNNRELLKVNQRVYLPEVAKVLCNLSSLLVAKLAFDKSQFDEAEEALKEAILIYRKLAQLNPHTFLASLASSSHNMGILLAKKGSKPEAEKVLKECLQIYRNLITLSPHAYSHKLALVLNTLGAIMDRTELNKVEETLKEALKISRELAKNNPQVFGHDVAQVQGNLGIFYAQNKEYNKASRAFQETLQIYRKLAQIDFQIFNPHVAVAALNMSKFYQKYRPNKKKSIALAQEAIQCALPFINERKECLDTVHSVIFIVSYWGLDIKSFLGEFTDIKVTVNYTTNNAP